MRWVPASVGCSENQPQAIFSSASSISVIAKAFFKKNQNLIVIHNNEMLFYNPLTSQCDRSNSA